MIEVQAVMKEDDGDGDRDQSIEIQVPLEPFKLASETLSDSTYTTLSQERKQAMIAIKKRRIS